MSYLGGIAALISAAVGLLGYIGWVVRRISARLKAWEQLTREHQALMDVAHWHEHGRVIPLTYPGPQHRRRRAL